MWREMLRATMVKADAPQIPLSWPGLVGMMRQGPWMQIRQQMPV